MITLENGVLKGVHIMYTLRDLREQAGLTVVELATLAGVSVSTVNRAENSKLSVRKVMVFKMLRALNTRLSSDVKFDSLVDPEE